MIFLYNLSLLVLFLLLIPLALVILILKPNLVRKLLERLGKVPPAFASYLQELKKENKAVIWINAASVGELMMSQPIIRELTSRDASLGYIISTNSSSGLKMGKQLFGEEKVFLLPIDLPWIAKRMAQKIGPKLTILVEFEMGPNLIRQLVKTGSRIVLINATMENNTAKMYSKIPSLFKDTLNQLDFIGVQNQEEKERMLALGVKPTNIKVTGNMKYDNRSKRVEGVEQLALKKRLQIPEHKQVLIAGSTQPGEKENIFRVYTELKKELADLVLIVAPRQIERTAELKQLAEMYGFTAIERTKIVGHEDCPTTGHNVIILDTIGELADLYSIATVVFVGGTFAKIGGHNLLEPVFYGKPVLFGPVIYKVRKMADYLQQNGIGIMVRNEDELRKTLLSLLQDEERLQTIAHRAKDFLEVMGGATQRNMQVIGGFLANSE